MDILRKNFLQFIKAHYPLGQKVLLGLSGGADSKVLFHLLLEEKIPFGAAHVDHAWREESQEEQRLLSDYCQSFHVPFHACVLPKKEGGKNLEEEGRQARYQFFKELCYQENYGGVMVAHHADDQAETVLKRLFEGATLRRLKGLSPSTYVEGLRIWRPLLNVTKKDILEWLEEKKISYFSDRTNEDTRFLRSRMRQDLLPYLSKTFGKEVASSLCRLGKASFELDEFLEEVLVPYRERMKIAEGNASFDLSYDFPQTFFEWKLVVHDFFEKQKISVSSTIIEAICAHLQKKHGVTSMQVGKRNVTMNRGILTVFGNNENN